ncbi:MAG: hypothetical protein KY457_09060 [Actinobacteria bacterium]|nr:hypothetical protein [Actinomycetota bacterium]
MDRSRLRPVAAALAAVAGVLAGIAMVRRTRRQRSPELFAPEPVTPARAGGRRGRPEDRGRGPSFGLDVDRLKETGGFEPVVHYLTYIQEQRGDGSHLLFVRYDDLDAMAEIDGEPTPSFLERLEQLGVVVSTN